MEMPLPDAATIARRDEIATALRQIVPGEGVIVSEPQRRAYESDGLTAYHQPPLVVVLPSTVAQVAAVLREACGYEPQLVHFPVIGRCPECRHAHS